MIVVFHDVKPCQHIPLKVFDRHILGLMFYVEYRWQITISDALCQENNKPADGL